jgi:DNA-binding NtrC family response regulator
MKRVLIVEDNRPLAMFAAQHIDRAIADVEVETASTCERARQCFHPDGPIVLIADENLPDGNGIDLSNELSALHPVAGVIIISGDPIIRIPKGYAGGLQKPFEPHQLVQMVSRIFGSTQMQNAVAAAERSPKSGRRPAPDRHSIQNRLSGLLAGLRAMGADLEAGAEDPVKVRAAVADYVDHLCGMVKDVSAMLREEDGR